MFCYTLKIFSSLFRFLQILFVLSVNGVFLPTKILKITLFPFTLISALFLWRNKNGKGLVRSFSKLNTVFIKLGQSLSLKPYIVGNKIAKILSQLRDNVDFNEKDIDIRKEFYKEIGRKISKNFDDVFNNLSKKHISSASIASVYSANYTKTGERVAIKIIKPNIRKVIDKDFAILFFIAKMIKIIKPIKGIDVVRFVENLKNNTLLEIDLKNEARNNIKLRQNFAFDSNVSCPRVIEEISTKNILVMEFVDGCNLNDKEVSNISQWKRDLITKRIIKIFCDQIYYDGFFHADMHHGNIMININDIYSPIYIIDCGNCVLLNYKDRSDLAKIIYYFYKNQFDKVANVYFNSNFVNSNINYDILRDGIYKIGKEMGSNISISLFFQNMFKLWKELNQEVPEGLFMFQKAILYLEGVCSSLSPDINIFQEAIPYAKSWWIKNESPEIQIFNKIVGFIQKIIS